MKSSRSLSTKNTRRNARKLLSESSDDSDSSRDSSNANMDSARAEKVFSRRIPPKSTSNLNTHTIKAEKSLFRVSDSSDSVSSRRSSSMDKNKSEDNKRKLLKYNQTTDKSILKPSKGDLLKYRNILLSSDDDQSTSSKVDVSNDTSVSKKSSVITENDQSGEDCLLEEFIDKSIQSSSGSITSNESFCITSKNFRNKKIILDSSEESDNGQTTSNSSAINDTNIILGSESDNDIINSSNEIDKKSSKNIIPKKSQIDIKLKEMSLIEPSDSDLETSMHYKSTIAFPKKNRTFIDNLTFSNATHFSHDPISHSSVLENSIIEIPIKNVSNVQENNEVNILEDSPIITSKPKEIQPKQMYPVLIDLTENEYNDNSSESSKYNSFDNSKKITTNEFESLKMEKRKLDEIILRFTKNIDNMKMTMKITNLHLLPDKGLKLKKAISKEESLLKDTEMQLKNVLNKLKEFPDSHRNYLEKPKISPPFSFEPVKLSDIKNGLTKKAAANIDINAMGNQALNTYRTQQTMTLDVLHSLHKSLETCPTPNILANDPPGLKVELMPHQKHAIAWLMWRESQKPHGGILADDMGLGKTLTMISLILKATETEKIKEDSDSDDTDDSFKDTQRNNIKGGTLVICPSSLINQWQNEIKTKLRPRVLDVLEHYGSNRESSARRLARKDIVITTYHVVMWDQKKKNNSPLFQIKWKRIILDEAHCIRNYKSQTSIAVSALSGTYRWALSGTPIHNKQDDFYALLKFIKCHPFHEWAIWKRWVGNNDDAGKSRLSLLVKTLMLRRTKAELSEQTSFKLPTKTFHTIDIELFKEEKEVYEKVLLFSSTLFSTYLYEKAEKENAIKYGFPVQNKAKYLHQKDLNDNIFQDHPELDKLFKQLKSNKNIQAHHILVLLLRLRQLCCHPCLMKNMLDDETLKVDGIQNTGDLDIVDHMSRMSIGIPSVEREALTNSNPIFKDSWVSSKVKAVCDMVKEKVLPTDDKAIIVSQWPSMLLLIGKQLSQYSVKTELFSGAVSIPNRNKIVTEFNNLREGPKILLLSLTAGGVGLNLVAANHLFLVDIHWNPQLEAQACDRIYRVGQTKTVNVYKFICTNTIENSIQSLQSKKIELANNLFGGCKNVEGTKITLDDLKQIFNMNPSNK